MFAFLSQCLFCQHKFLSLLSPPFLLRPSLHASRLPYRRPLKGMVPSTFPTMVPTRLPPPPRCLSGITMLPLFWNPGLLAQRIFFASGTAVLLPECLSGSSSRVAQQGARLPRAASWHTCRARIPARRCRSPLSGRRRSGPPSGRRTTPPPCS